VRQFSSDPDESTGFLVPAIIAFGGGLLIGAVLISAKSQAFGLPRIRGRQRSCPTLLSDRARRLRLRMSGNALEGPTVSTGMRERVTGFAESNRLDASRCVASLGGMSDPERSREPDSR